MVAAFACGEGPVLSAGADEAIVCSSLVGFSLKMSRSPDLSSLQYAKKKNQENDSRMWENARTRVRYA